MTRVILMAADAFAYYRPEEEAFDYNPGRFEILVGASSDDIRLRKPIAVK